MVVDGRLKRRWAGVPLRTRIAGLLLALVAVGLLVSGLAAVTALRGYLFKEVDESLTETAQNFSEGAQQRGGGGRGRPGPTGDDFRYIRTSNSTGTAHQEVGSSATLSDPPDLPNLSVAELQTMGGQPFVVDSESGAARWRAVGLPLADRSGSVTVAQEISGIDATVQRLALIELGIGTVVLALLGGLGWFLVRGSLRPLRHVEHAAAVIASGDLSHRAPTPDPRTEVGSLAHSFNTMVEALSGAFQAQQASEREALRSAEVARASEARMRQFVADASHELRTPLTSVRGFAELYRIGAVPPGPKLDDAMARIESEASRMGVLVEDLLLLARLDQARPLQVTEVDLLDVVTDSAAAARAAAPDRTIQVDVDPAGAPAIVTGDPGRLRQVVDNLLSNALRYSSADQPALLRVSTCSAQEAAAIAAPAGSTGMLQVGQDAPVAVLDVIDRGSGMSDEVAARVFERFYREDRARSREHGGAGLGLAIVAAIIAAHGGRVEVRTNPGRGTAFRLLLPVAAAPAVPDAPAAAPADLTRIAV
jgi:two-component system, OmpR family, sensor kinase